MPMKSVALADGTKVPVLGQGTWEIEKGARGEAIAALRLGLDLGMSLIDTAEMYGEGEAERIVKEAIAGRRDEVFLVSKVYPWNAGRKDMRAACHRSLKRLGTDRLDLYLLHWRGEVPLADTLAGFRDLRAAGKIRRWGVSNFDRGDMEELAALGGKDVATNQVLYNLAKRAPEWALLPWSRERGIPLMAYSPFDQGPLLKHKGLKAVAERLGATPAQVALAWLLRQEGVFTIPKSGRPTHVRENHAALELVLSAADLADLDRAFPPPSGAVALDVG
jgi:diketogulonate reductase-like aldo/keto reductase